MIAYLPPARTYRYALKKGMNGHEVYSLQVLLNDVRGAGLAEDGAFGPATDAAVRKFQTSFGLVVDGIAGIATQRRLGTKAAEKVTVSLPPGLLKGITEGESGWAVGCVNWDVRGGVDCGLIQDRVYDGTVGNEPNEFGSAARWREAFGLKSVNACGVTLRQAKDKFYKRAKDSSTIPDLTHQRAWELATLNHNYPYAADRLSRGLAMSEAPAAWVLAIGVRGVESPADWCRFYIERMTCYCTEWPA